MSTTRPQYFQQRLDWLQQPEHLNVLTGLLHGLEKEGLRVNPEGDIAFTKHPKELGSALTHSKITTDYAEALLEFITSPVSDSQEALQQLEQLHQVTYQHLNQEIIWAGSMPGNIADADAIPIAQYGTSNTGLLKTLYREGLHHRYGKMMQVIAGLHYNFSLPLEFWPNYQKFCSNTGTAQQFRSDQYFCLIRNFRRYNWLPLYLFGASPVLTKSFVENNPHNLQELDKDSLHLPYATSLRMSDLGYSSKAQASLNVCFNSLDSYRKSLKNAINTEYPEYTKIGLKQDDKHLQINQNILQIDNEYYSDIRPKCVSRSGEMQINTLGQQGVEYIEIRNTDLNPFMPVGIDQTQMDFMDCFLLFCLFIEDKRIDIDECKTIIDNTNLTLIQGRKPDLTLNRQGYNIKLNNWALEVLEHCQTIAKLLDKASNTERYSQAVAAQKEKITNPSLTPAAQILAHLKSENISYSDFVLQQSKAHKNKFKAQNLTVEQKQYFTEQAKQSLEKQRKMEAKNQDDFSEFLAKYLAQ